MGNTGHFLRFAKPWPIDGDLPQPPDSSGRVIRLADWRQSGSLLLEIGDLLKSPRFFLRNDWEMSQSKPLLRFH